MTYKEKWENEHPGKAFSPYEGCPKDEDGYEIDCRNIITEPKSCLPFTPECDRCWDREIPETEEKLQGQRAKLPLVESDGVPKEIIDEVLAPLDIPTIKDSGDRTQFETGAVRDMREGKGRCDLMPLEVVANYICEDNDDTNRVLWALREFQKTNSTSYLYSALNSFDGACYGNSFTMFLEVAKHFEEGAKKYGENNWQKGIPTHCYVDSAIRHYLKWLRGDKDEPHDRAFVWNVMCCIWEVDHRKGDSQ